MMYRINGLLPMNRKGLETYLKQSGMLESATNGVIVKNEALPSMRNTKKHGIVYKKTKPKPYKDVDALIAHYIQIGMIQEVRGYRPFGQLRG